ncbi:hypothetical protein VSDG_02353 [Cytospora chrysosperma]|uniref:Uncharacterized protein n=1 Tax=Cytospora chrysosperma TaxID=252740 RepID=A0A423WFY9_CYTCH|nr:hypothetical protein VSDG_02353 [Valsa sordida]
MSLTEIDHPMSVEMTSRIPSKDEAHISHYPLNMDLPFERYEHRRLAARDILVHRIISKLLYPGSRGLAQVYGTRRSNAHGLHNFGAVRKYDRILARDLELLRKMLTTCSATDNLYDPFIKPVRMALQPQYRVGGLAGLQPPTSILDLPGHEGSHLQVTIEEEILDLIRRHYLEFDDPSTRLWLDATQPLMPSSYNTLPSMPKAKDTHAALAQQRKKVDWFSRGQDEKRWYLEDTEHLQSLQGSTRTSHSLRLYDGGALLPPLRQPLLQARAARMKYLTMKTEQGDCQGSTPQKLYSMPPRGGAGDINISGSEICGLRPRLTLQVAGPGGGWTEMVSGPPAAGVTRKETEEGWGDAGADEHRVNRLLTCSPRLGCRGAFFIPERC